MTNSVDQFIRIPLYRRPIFYAAVNAFLCFVPGPVLLLCGGRTAPILPLPLIKAIAPLSVLQYEKSIIAALLDWAPRLGKMRKSGFDLNAFDQQFLIIAFLSFFLVLIVLACQTWVGALYSETQDLKAWILLKSTLACVGLRVASIGIMVLDPSSASLNQPTANAAFHILRWTAPEIVILATCCVAMGLWQFGLVLVNALKNAMG